jgi:hypothetical protein
MALLIALMILFGGSVDDDVRFGVAGLFPNHTRQATAMLKAEGCHVTEDLTASCERAQGPDR